MNAQYLVRLDDACETMNRHKWGLIERLLDQLAIKPIVAVVPDNQDPSLVFGEHDSLFWEKVRAWAAKGWTIAMHGHTHVMQPTNSKLLVPYYARSEFAGLALDHQADKIRAAWQKFQTEGVVPDVWVAPAHSFDEVTLEALGKETSIRVVSDGIAFSPYYEHGFHWIPQQLWNPVRRTSGLWTICLHPNGMSDSEISAFGNTMTSGFGDKITSFNQVRLSSHGKTLVGCIYHQYFWWRWRNRPKAAA